MRRSSVALLLALCTTILSVACSDTTANRPGATAPSEAVAIGSPSAVSATCDYPTITTAAQSYFTSTTDPVFPLILSMQVTSAHGLSAATDASWPITRIVASARLTSRVTSAAAGKTFLGALFACTNLIGNASSTDVALTDEATEYADFIGNAELILQQGLFAVRDGSSSAPAAALLSFNGLRSFAAPRWGIEATGGTWPAPATGVAYLVYGYPTVNAVTQVTPASAINTNNGGSPSAFNAFALGSLPKAQPKLPLLVSVCSQATGSASANRLVHSTSIQVNESATQLCGTSYLASLDMPAGHSSLRGIGAALVSLISPRPLFAQDPALLSIGGHVSDWSPFTTATLTSTNLSITFKTQPTNSDVSTPEPIDVLVASNGLGVPGMSVTLNLLNNSGIPAGAGFSPTSSVDTDASGVAHFLVTFNKPGGYTVTATGVLNPLSITTASSRRFNIKN